MLQVCGFATINRGGWMNVNTLVILMSVMIAALVYAVANFLPTEKRERLKGAARYEIIEAVISLIIVIILVALCLFSCSAGAAIMGYSGYTDVFGSAGTYVGSLLFTNGVSLMGNFYTVSAQYEVISSLFNVGNENFMSAWSSIFPQTAGFSIKLDIPMTGSAFFGAMSKLYVGSYAAMLDVSFAGLFILFLLLQMIQAGALTIVAPTALIMRSLSFLGPQLRRTSNIFLALAIGFYFVFPLMVVSNIYMASCLNINTGMTQTAKCSYPYFSAYLQGYNIPTASVSLFTSTTQYPISSGVLPTFAQGGLAGMLSIPASFYGPVFTGSGQFVSLMFHGPDVAMQYGTEVAGYLFLSIVLIALDLGVTAAFVMGISRGLDSIGNVFGGGPFFGG